MVQKVVASLECYEQQSANPHFNFDYFNIGISYDLSLRKPQDGNPIVMPQVLTSKCGAIEVALTYDNPFTSLTPHELIIARNIWNRCRV